MSGQTRRCEAAVSRKVKDYDGTLAPFFDDKPNELVTDQCRRAASTTEDASHVCAAHAADLKNGLISNPEPYVGKGHWEWISDE